MKLTAREWFCKSFEMFAARNHLPFASASSHFQIEVCRTRGDPNKSSNQLLTRLVYANAVFFAGILRTMLETNRLILS